MAWVRRHYDVPAKRGGRVRYTGEGDDKPEFGTIRSASGGHLNIQLDGRRFPLPFHPTWKLEYLPEGQA